MSRRTAESARKLHGGAGRRFVLAGYYGMFFCGISGIVVGPLALFAVGDGESLGQLGLLALLVPVLAGIERGLGAAVVVGPNQCQVRNAWRSYRFSTADLLSVGPTLFVGTMDCVAFEVRNRNRLISSVALGSEDLPELNSALPKQDGGQNDRPEKGSPNAVSG